MLVHRHVKPGGWVEINEFDIRLYSDDGTLTEETHIWKFYDLVNKAAAKAGTFALSPTCQKNKNRFANTG